MDSKTTFFLRFTNREYSTAYKVLSLVPGTFVFLILSPFVLFFIARYLGGFISLSLPRPIELTISSLAALLAVVLMFWALYELWTTGQGTPAPIAPTKKLVTAGPYRLCRNPIELGTELYFLALGTWFDSLITGILCLLFGMGLGLGYIKFIEEKEMSLRFGEAYREYNRQTPLLPLLWGRRDDQ